MVCVTFKHAPKIFGGRRRRGDKPVRLVRHAKCQLNYRIRNESFQVGGDDHFRILCVDSSCLSLSLVLFFLSAGSRLIGCCRQLSYFRVSALSLLLSSWIQIGTIPFWSQSVSRPISRRLSQHRSFVSIINPKALIRLASKREGGRNFEINHFQPETSTRISEKD